MCHSIKVRLSFTWKIPICCRQVGLDPCIANFADHKNVKLCSGSHATFVIANQSVYAR